MTDRLSETDPSELDVGGDEQDELFDVLSDHRRRSTLQYLRTADTPLLVEELASELLARENHRREPSHVGDREAIEVSLRHAHLPKMADAGFVRYDATWQTVTLGDRADEVWAHLRAIPTD